MARRRRRRGAGFVLTLLVLVAVAGAVVGVVRWLDATHPAPVASVCTATSAGTTWRLSPEQADNAAVIAAVGLRRSLPAHAVTVALATALQESGLRNLDHGDRDSLGLFQQRPSQSWGTAAQVQDPVYASGAFYDRLVTVANWQTIPVTEAAQAVQRSAFGDAYAAHEPGARAFASALTGWSTAALSCTLPTASSAGPTGADAGAAFTARVQRDWGELPVTAVAGTAGAVSIDARQLAGADQADRLGWAAGQWAVATAGVQPIQSVQVADRRWVRGTVGWAQLPTSVPAGTVVVVLAG
jgi:hypothetical protein